MVSQLQGKILGPHLRALRDRRPQRGRRSATHFIDDWEEMAASMPAELVADDALWLLSECIMISRSGLEGSDGFERLADRFSLLLVRNANKLAVRRRTRYAMGVAKMFAGRLDSIILERR
jgi:hypothetical protein